MTPRVRGASAHPLPAHPRKSNNGKLELLCTGRQVAQRSKRAFLVPRRREERGSGLVELPPDHAHEGQRPQLAAPVHPISDDELVRTHGPNVVRPDVRLSS